MVGRRTGLIRLWVLENVDGASLEAFAGRATKAGATLYTDEWGGYNWVAGSGRGHATVCHSARPREWARDDDGDGVQEVHDNTMEGTWTGLRNFLRPFRGVSKWFLDQYVAIFEWTHNLKAVNGDFIRVLVGLKPTTASGT